MSGRFGFTIQRAYGTDDLWIVSLPHQCDEWDIAGEYMAGESHDEAVESLQRFIAEAQGALEALKARREIEAP